MSAFQQLSYPRLARALAAAGGEVSPAEAQGLLLGLLCTARDDIHGKWLDELVEAPESENDVLTRECVTLLRQLADITENQLNDENYELAFFVPDDEQSMTDRAVALLEWIQGFLYGLGLGGQQFVRSLSSNQILEEGLKDLAELTRMDVAALEQGDDSQENALFEISEYVRVIALTAYQGRMSQGGEYE